MGSFPNRRLLPVGVAVGLVLVLATGQRLVLMGLGIPEEIRTLDRGWAAVVHGMRSDLAATAWLCVPFVAWATVLPERAWRAHGHRVLTFAALAAGLALTVTYLTLDGLSLAQSDERLAARSRPDVAVWSEQFERGSDALVAGATLAALALGALGAAACWPLVAPAWSERERPVDRARDLLLLLALGTLAVVSAPRPGTGAASSALSAAAARAHAEAAPRLRALAR